MIKILEEGVYFDLDDNDNDLIKMVKATILVPLEQWVIFKRHIEELERVEAKRKEIFAELIGLDDD